MEWLKQLSQVIDYIEANLDKKISYEEAAKIACCSTYYFQRIFSYVVGISLSEYIRRRRMTKAAFELQTSEVRVIEIGSKYGYSSPAAFNRAFQSVHGVAPIAARMKGQRLTSYPRISFSISVTGGGAMRYRIENKEAIRIVGVKVPLVENQEKNFEIVPRFWDKTINNNLLSKICKLNNKQPSGVLGVTVYQNPKEIYYYIATSTDSEVPEKMVEYKIPSATWAIFECDGNFPESIQSIYRRFLTEWLPVSGYEYAKQPDVEVYPISNQELKTAHSEVWIAIKKLN